MIGEKKAYIISSVILAIASAICLTFAVQVVSKGFVTIGGYSLFRVVTGSMEPTISTGAVLLCKETAIEKIKTDDIVCYRTKVAEIYGSTVTHRVVNIQTDENGRIHLETRGDANVSSDPYYVNESNLIGKVTWYSGKESVINDMLSFLTGKIGFLLCVVFPVLLVSGLVMQRSVKSLKKDLALAKQELKQEEKGSQLLPGYTTLTYADYEAIYETLRKELLEELNGKNQGTDRKEEKDPLTELHNDTHSEFSGESGEEL